MRLLGLIAVSSSKREDSEIVGVLALDLNELEELRSAASAARLTP